MHISIWTLTFLLLFSSAASSGDAAAPAGDGFPAFWQRFSAAVAHDNQTEVRDLTRLPFLFEGEPHGADRFGRVYAALFGSDARACLAKAEPKPEQGMYMAFCGPIVFVFARQGETWKLAEFTADPEQ